MAMLPASLVLAERSVPRYTSYPTAPHFSGAVNADVAENWLSELARRCFMWVACPAPLRR